MNVFKVAEVVDMGIEKEKKRRDFYGAVANEFKDNKQMSELFSKLRDWEEMHIVKFTQIRKRLRDKTVESYPGELNEYMGALVDDKLYKEVSVDSFKQNISSPLSAIEYGIIFEKDAILFFSELIPYIDVGDKEIINKLIEEEKRHVVYLSQLKRDFIKNGVSV